MINFAKLLRNFLKNKPKPVPPVPVSCPLYTLRVEVFEGDPGADNKIPGAFCVLGDRVQVADAAGNAHFPDTMAGSYHLKVTAEGFTVVEQDVVVPSEAVKVSLEQSFKPLSRITANGRIFMQDGQPWRWKGVTAFKLLNKHAAGENIVPFLDAYKGYNVLRVFAYTPVKDWGAQAWDMPTAAQVKEFVKFVERYGFYVELVLLTSDESSMVDRAKQLLSGLSSTELPSLFIEIGNEPLTHKNIAVSKLRNQCEASGFLYTSGVYEDSKQWFGKFGTAHTGRDSEWPRRAHDLMEYYNGGGPNSPDEPACKAPWVADEPIRPDQASGDKHMDVIGYFGTCSILGAGATVHTESGKYANLPFDSEKPWIANALFAMNAFPADAPNGPYRRIVEDSLRTYVVGSNMVRVRPTTQNPPEQAGWQQLEGTYSLWRR